MAIARSVSACASPFRLLCEELVQRPCGLFQDDPLHVLGHEHCCTVVVHLLQLEQDADVEGLTRGLEPCGCLDDHVAVGELVTLRAVGVRRQAVHDEVERLVLEGGRNSHHEAKREAVASHLTQRAGHLELFGKLDTGLVRREHGLIQLDHTSRLLMGSRYI